MMDGFFAGDSGPGILRQREIRLSRTCVSITSFDYGLRIVSFSTADEFALHVTMHLSRADIVALRDALDASLALDAPEQADAMLRARAGKSGEAK